MFRDVEKELGVVLSRKCDEYGLNREDKAGISTLVVFGASIIKGGKFTNGIKKMGSKVERPHIENSRLIYAPTPKHAKGGFGSPNPIPNMSLGQKLLENAYSVPNKKQKFNIYEGKMIKFQPDNAGGWHSYEIREKFIKDVPTEVLRKMRNDGLISKTLYKKWVNG